MTSSEPGRSSHGPASPSASAPVDPSASAPAGRSGRPRALITGASSGIGRGFAEHLAADGYDLVLVARDEERLRAVAADLESEHGILAEVLPADLATAADRARMAEMIESTRIDVLVNNAGYGVASGLLDSDLDDLRDLDEVLSGAVRDFSILAARRMVERGRGGIVNVSSLAAVTTMGQYATSKAAVLTFTQALAGELQGTGVTATVVLPGFVRTEFHSRLGVERPGPRWIWLDVDRLVTRSLRDARNGRVVSVPGIHYALADRVARLLPRRIIQRGSQKFSFNRHSARES